MNSSTTNKDETLTYGEKTQKDNENGVSSRILITRQPKRDYGLITLGVTTGLALITVAICTHIHSGSFWSSFLLFVLGCTCLVFTVIPQARRVLYMILAKSGKAESQFRIGMDYYETKDTEKALKWLKKAADKGSADAMYNLGVIYYMGSGVTTDYSESASWMKAACNLGDTESCWLLGAYYRDGIGVEQNPEEAVRLFKSASNKGYPAALTSLGHCYFDGFGVEQNYKEAVSLYAKAANLGDHIAQGALGICYFKGDGIEQDYTKAFNWFSKTYTYEPLAQFYYGLCIYEGLGTEKSSVIGLHYIKQASERGCITAQEYIAHHNL